MDDQPHRARRTGPAAALAVLTVVAVVLAVALTPWWTVLVPFSLVGACAAWWGLTGEELLDALGPGGDDVGRGPAGLAP